jgi:hypothetical protein
MEKNFEEEVEELLQTEESGAGMNPCSIASICCNFYSLYFLQQEWMK